MACFHGQGLTWFASSMEYITLTLVFLINFSIFSLSGGDEDFAVHCQFQGAASLSSCVSLKSDRSMAEPPKFSDNVGHLQAR